MSHEILLNTKLALPWTWVIGRTEADRLVAEFLLEAPYLTDALPQAIARRLDSDAVLFHFKETREVRQGRFPFGVVNLTWSGAKEPSIGTQIEFFECWNHWETEGMQRVD